MPAPEFYKDVRHHLRLLARAANAAQASADAALTPAAADAAYLRLDATNSPLTAPLTITGALSGGGHVLSLHNPEDGASVAGSAGLNTLGATIQSLAFTVASEGDPAASIHAINYNTAGSGWFSEGSFATRHDAGLSFRVLNDSTVVDALNITNLGNLVLLTSAHIDFSGGLSRKLLLHPSGIGYAIGIESSTMYFETGGVFRWYGSNLADGGTSAIMELGGSITTDVELAIRSRTHAGILLDSDINNTSGEPGGAYVLMTHDGGAVFGGIAHVQNQVPYPGGPTIGTAVNDLLVFSSQAIVFSAQNTSPHSGFISGDDLTMAGNVTAMSDARHKTNLQRIPSALAKVQALNGYTYERTDRESGRRQVGVTAQELESVLPEAVCTDERSGFKSVAYGNISALLIEAVKELSDRVDAVYRL